MTGVNVPRDGSIPAQSAASLGARWLRFVLMPDVDLTPWLRDARARRLMVLGVIARESLVGSYDDTAMLYADRYGDLLDSIQGGNESDHESPSSWTMAPGDLNDLLAAINMHWQHVTIVGPGMVSGNPHYLDAVDMDLLDAIAVHPYGQRPDNVQDWSETPGNFGSVAGLLDSYRYHNKPIWVTEVGVSTHQVSEAFQARYCEAMMKALQLRRDVPVACWFALHDHDGFGLMREDGSLKPSAAAYRAASGQQEQPMPIVKAIDVSSHQPRDLTALIQMHQPEHVIVKGYLPIENISQDHTRAQVHSARKNGCTVGMYVWCYRSADPIATIDAIITLCASVDLALPLLWLDCETYNTGTSNDPGPDSEWLARAVDYSERVYGMKCGIYTGLWWIRGHFPGGEGEFANFSRLPIWLSEYDHVADINDINLPMGWTQAVAKQYSADGIDLNVIRSEYTVYQGGGEPEPDPCENMRRQLQAWIDTRPYRAPSKKKLSALLS